MWESNNLDIVLWLLVGVVAFFVLLGLFVRLCIFITDFSVEMRYLNNEIGRTDGAERRYWLRRKRRLWLSVIPFVKY